MSAGLKVVRGVVGTAFEIASITRPISKKPDEAIAFNPIRITADGLDIVTLVARKPRSVTTVTMTKREWRDLVHQIENSEDRGEW